MIIDDPWVRNAQGVDSKVGELIYPLRRVDLMKFIQNEPIPTEIWKKYTKLVKIVKLSISK